MPFKKTGLSGFIYKISGKFRFLKHREHYFIRPPRKIRYKKILRNRRTRRHAFLLLRPMVFTRYRRYGIGTKTIKLQSGPLGYESFFFFGYKPESYLLPKPPKKKTFLSVKDIIVLSEINTVFKE